MKNERSLGRGLGALLANPAPHESIRELPLEEVVNRPHQPRKHFDETTLQELAASIRLHGLLQPILVHLHNGKYEIIAGERRWRAAKLAGLTTIPAIVRETNEQQVSELALIENLQRENLGILEEAAAYQALLQSYGYTQEELAAKLGKGRVAISNTMRLLQLTPPVLEMLQNHEFTPGHARALLRVRDAEQQLRLARYIVQQDLNVRQTEAYINHWLEQSVSVPAKEIPKKTPLSENVYTRALEEQMQNHFSSKIKICSKGAKGGKIELYYADNEDLTRLLDLMGFEPES